MIDNKEDYLAALNAEVAKLPSGTMSGGTRTAAANFVRQMGPLELDEIKAVIGMRTQSLPAGDFRNWLASLPE